MKISTVMATYNGEKYILEQLQSILNQNRKVDEVIVMDDLSSDDTVEIVKKFILRNSLNDSWFVYKNIENLGYKKNFQKGFEIATGDIIILCDQDDIWEPNKVESIENVFIKTNALAMNSAFRFIDGDGNLINEIENNNNNNLLRRDCKTDEVISIAFETILETNISPGCTMAISKKLKDIFLDVTEGWLPHDWELNIIASLYEGDYFYNRKLTKYRIHGNNTIGLETDLRRVKLRSNITYEKRCSIILEKIQMAKFVDLLHEKEMVNGDKYSVFSRLRTYDNLRYKCVVERKWYIWFFMVMYAIFIYKYHYIRPSALVGDLLFSIGMYDEKC